MRGLILVGLCFWLLRGQPECALHKLENVRQQSEETLTENINFNDILKQLLKIIDLAKINHFQSLGGNIIKTAHDEICLNGGISLELESAQNLQSRGIQGNFLLQVRWLASELLRQWKFQRPIFPQG